MVRVSDIKPCTKDQKGSAVAPQSTNEAPVQAENDEQAPAWRRALVALLLLSVGTGAALMGTTSTFTEAEDRTQDVTSGTFVFTLGDPATATTRFSEDITGMAPGDFADRLVTLNNTGTLDFSSVSIALATPNTSSTLDTDDNDGLQLQIASCPQAWTQASSSVGATCGGGFTATVLTALMPVKDVKTAGPSYTSGLTALTGGSTYLRFHYELPTTSVGTDGKSSELVYTFTATQLVNPTYH